MARTARQPEGVVRAHLFGDGLRRGTMARPSSESECSRVCGKMGSTRNCSLLALQAVLAMLFFWNKLLFLGPRVGGDRIRSSTLVAPD